MWHPTLYLNYVMKLEIAIVMLEPLVVIAVCAYQAIFKQEEDVNVS